MVKIGTNLKGLNILLGVSGGIAAYKAVDLASKLTGAGAKVNTVMTENACRFVGPKSFEAITRSKVYTTLWSKAEEFEVSHISLADWADIVVVAPATANIIGKAAGGICDGLLSTTLCACWQKPVLLAPAMNEKMWNNPAVQRNVKMVCEMGFETIGPEEGLLACGAEGVGRMSEPQDIIQRIEKIASRIQGDKT
ncbi:MAG: bifunctional phosphopantothenoylcysteine decarboxylase/phosphopantothenate--cysteine ligase CoaBC [Planctomycetota bacterium]|jgi:phosphopantothenoylcysteine decarboxylase/phosphopantothenate--cysteine ligase